METRQLICIGCPLGCPLTAVIKDREITVNGHTCKRGEDYARKEILNPSRTVTSTIRVTGGEIAMVSVKTAQDIPKGKIMDVMKEIRQARAVAPVQIGDILIEDCAGTGVDIVATKDAGYLAKENNLPIISDEDLRRFKWKRIDEVIW